VYKTLHVILHLITYYILSRGSMHRMIADLYSSEEAHFATSISVHHSLTSALVALVATIYL
jgi:hypothetical protein